MAPSAILLLRVSSLLCASGSRFVECKVFPHTSALLLVSGKDKRQSNFSKLARTLSKFSADFSLFKDLVLINLDFDY